MTDIRRMQLGQVVDFVIAYNDRQERSAKKAKAEKEGVHRRKATQSDINAFFG